MNIRDYPLEFKLLTKKEKNMSLFFIGGVNGVGKTSIIREVVTISPSVLAVDGAKELMKRLNINNDNYDKLRNMPDELVEKALISLFRLLSQRKNKDVLITGHYVKIFNDKITPSIGPWYRYCDVLMLIYSNPEAIIRHIFYDEVSKKRIGRSLFKKTQPSILIKDAQIKSAEVMTKIAKEFKIPFYYIKNIENRLEEVSWQISKIIKERL
ncbi:hypothetical protein J7J23_01905 [bacterium]|nr:hypothetical protein [bacterium]